MASPELIWISFYENLRQAFAGEAQANRRYLYFARTADIEGYPEVGGLFRDIAEAETGHAFGHMDFLDPVADPVTLVPIGRTDQNLKSAVEGKTYELTQMYPGFAKVAREEGFEELAEWLETLAKAEKSALASSTRPCRASNCRAAGLTACRKRRGWIESRSVHPFPWRLLMTIQSPEF